MSRPWPPARTPQDERKSHHHRSVASLDTNASTIAGSLISGISGISNWTGEFGHARLFSQFPQPPGGIRDMPSPFSSSQPASPNSQQSFPTQDRYVEPLGTSSTSSSPHLSSSQRGFPRGVAQQSSPSQSFTSPSFSVAPLQTNKSEPWSKRIAARRAQTNAAPETHRDDGESIISVGASTENILSTAFITSLLSEVAAPGKRRKDSPLIPTSGHSQPGFQNSGPPPSRLAPLYVTQYESSDSLQIPNHLSVEPTSNSFKTPKHRKKPLRHRHYSYSVPASPAKTQNSQTSTNTQPSVYTEHSPTPTISGGTSEAYTDFSVENEPSPVIGVAQRSSGRNINDATIVGVVPARTILTPSMHELKPVNMRPTYSVMTPASLTHPPAHFPDVAESVTSPTTEEHHGHEQSSEIEIIFINPNDPSGSTTNLVYSPALPSGTSTRYDAYGPRTGKAATVRSKSIRSVRSLVSSVSRLTQSSVSAVSRRVPSISWSRRRPLPPLPLPPFPPPRLPHEEELRKREANIPLPNLVQRADLLANRLEREGWARSVVQYQGTEIITLDEMGSDTRKHNSFMQPRLRHLRTKSQEQQGPEEYEQASPTGKSRARINLSKKRSWVVAIVVIVLLAIILGVAIGVTVNRKHSSQAQSSCPGNFTGTQCNLDATCVCTSTVPGDCKQLALALFSYVSTVNGLFDTTFTASDVSNAVWQAQGTPVGPLCSAQAELIDVSPGLNSQTSPNRTEWAQAAIVWNLVLSSSLSSTTALRTFVQDAPWSALPGSDGTVTLNTTLLSTNQSGFVFDFAAQTVTPMSVSFQADATPTSAQLSQVSTIAGTALDRMYSFAAASSTQRQSSLLNYWQNILQQQSADLDKFLRLIRSAPLMVPFDATSSPGGKDLANLMTNSTSAPFPPPLSCYPGLSSSQLQRINQLETSVFGLQTATTPSDFNNSCYPDRPVYGVVDLLRLRLPYVDGRDDVGKQAAVLSTDAATRVVIYSGEILSALPGASNLTSLTASSTDPREFGTMNHLNHVVLNYLSSISDANVAIELVKFVLGGQSTPPSNDTIILQALSSLPVLEFAIFGSLTPSDFASSVSAFSKPSGSLFFGSGQGQIFRTWALLMSQSFVAWSELSISDQVVREGAAFDSDGLFEEVWTPASQLVQSGSTNPNDVQNVTKAFSDLHKFSP